MKPRVGFRMSNYDRQNCLDDIKELTELIRDNLKDFNYAEMQENVDILLETLIEFEGYESPVTQPSVGIN